MARFQRKALLSGVTGAPFLARHQSPPVTLLRRAFLLEIKEMSQKYHGCLFYFRDFCCDEKVRAMNWEERAMYLWLLWMSWEQKDPGTLPCDDALLADWLGISQKRWDRNKHNVLAAFTLEPDGRWHQKRLRNEYAKTQARSKAASAKVKKRWETSHGKNGESDTAVLQAQYAPSNTINSVSVSDEFSPLPTRKRFIDRKKPPFQESGMLASEEFQQSMKEWLKYSEERHGRMYTPLEFNALMNRFRQEVKSAKEAMKIIDEAISNGWKKPVFANDKRPI